MNPHRPLRAALALAIVLAWLTPAPPAGHAGIGGALKKKLGEAKKKAGEAADQATGDAAKDVSGDEAGEDAGSGAKPAGTAAAGDGGKVSQVSTKFDYVPGDKVLFLDDFASDDLGEFPARWRLIQGTFETAESGSERWLRVASDDGRVRPKLPTGEALPEFWTLEFDWIGTGHSKLTLFALDAQGNIAWEATFPQAQDFVMRSGEIFSSTPVSGDVEARRHLMFLARGKTIKAYVDRERVASVPETTDKAGPVKEFEFRLWESGRPMIANVRFAEGGRPAKDLLAEGRLVTHGIHFATGSDVVLPESAPILRQVAAWMEANPGARLRVTGHTDNVGSAASNLDLSKRRAASVARALSGEFGVVAARFETDGKGDTDAVASNGAPEGRAMNRRVEFAKLPD